MFLAPHRNSLTLVNNCKAQIDPAFYPAVQDHDRNPKGGFELAAGQQYTTYLLSGWKGDIWGRTGCDANGYCETGSCAGGVSCDGDAPDGVTLAQFNIGS